MEFKHQREIHSILKDYNPMTKICRKDSWSVHTCGRRKLASPRLVKLRKDYRAVQIPMKHLFRGAGNRLVTRYDAQPAEDPDALRKHEKSPDGENDYMKQNPSAMSVKAAGESLKGNLTDLLQESEHRKRYCVNGGSVAYNTANGIPMLPPPNERGSPRSPPLPNESRDLHSPGLGLTGLLPPPSSLGAVMNPGGFGGAQGSMDQIFVTATDSVSGHSPTDTLLATQTSGTVEKRKDQPASPSSPRQIKSSNLSYVSHPESPGRLSSLHSKRTDNKEYLPPIQPVTASHVMGGGTVGGGKAGTFEQYTQKLFECPSEKPILKYERQVGSESDDRKTLATDDGERTDFIEFRLKCIVQLTDYYDRSIAELKRYEAESRELFGQKFRTLDVPRLLSQKSACGAVASMENEIRNQHKRKQNELKKGIHQQWVQEFKAVIGQYPQTKGIRDIVTYVDEIICKEAREGSDLSRKHELSPKEFAELIGRLGRSHLLLDEIMSILHAIAPVFKTSTEQFAEIIRERLRPLFAKKKDEAGFDKDYKSYCALRKIKRTSSLRGWRSHQNTAGGERPEKHSLLQIAQMERAAREENKQQAEAPPVDTEPEKPVDPAIEAFINA
eukprot:TRINITY_DN30474_c0_g1_i1.p1 TRINITY_DN30474_c0_g1~~TRINITY_DN30474_c0_g1_i1.p1  ORF type:complete len:613 (+),score=229.39 TRINITY_DN30474_c0_g1_i1:101-1939(+)